jgi:hypothetical protein
LFEEVMPYVMNEAILVLIIAFVLAVVIAKYFAITAKERKKNRIQLKGRLAGLEWFYTSTGQVAIFLGVFLVIIAIYILLRSIPST